MLAHWRFGIARNSVMRAFRRQIYVPGEDIVLSILGLTGQMKIAGEAKNGRERESQLREREREAARAGAEVYVNIPFLADL